MLVIPPFARLPTSAVPLVLATLGFITTHPLQPSRVLCHGVTTAITHCSALQLKHVTNRFLNRSTQNQDPTKPTWHHRLHQHHQSVLRAPRSTAQRTIYRSLSRLPHPFSDRNGNLIRSHHPNQANAPLQSKNNAFYKNSIIYRVGIILQRSRKPRAYTHSTPQHFHHTPSNRPPWQHYE
jgi:hypothetical protein